MRPLSELRQDFEVSRSLGDIIDVLKTAALIQFRFFQSKAKPLDDFGQELETCLNILKQKKLSHPYLLERKRLPSCIVVVTSDEGFLGELTTLLINSCLEQINTDNDTVIVLGERGVRYLEDVNQKFHSFSGISDDVSYAEAEKLRNLLLKDYAKKFGKMIIIYPRFVSLTVQRVTVLQLLPYQQSGYIPEINRRISIDEMLMEPSNMGILKTVVNLWVGFKLFEVFWSAKQSEFAARIMHLEGSTQELNHLKQKLSFEYFRQVHALRDKVIREISASKILLGKK